MITFHFWNMTEYFLHKLYIQGVEKILDHKEGDLEKTYYRVLQQKLLNLLKSHKSQNELPYLLYYLTIVVVSFWPFENND